MKSDEINRRVAEIEGWKLMGFGGHEPRWWPPGTHPAQNLFSLPKTPPPYATDWTWCGPLIAKYSLSVICADGWTAANAHVGKSSETPQRAICLAVIAAAPTPATLLPEAPVHDSDHN